MSQIQRYDITTALPDIETITGDSGGAVGPDGAGNVNIVGGSNINTVGNPGANSLTINLDSNIAATYTVSTSGAVTATLFTFTVSAGSAVVVRALILGIKDDFSAGIQVGTSMGARRTAAGATAIIGSGQAPRNDFTNPDPSIDWDTSGNDVRLRVTGKAGDNIDWIARIDYEVL